MTPEQHRQARAICTAVLTKEPAARDAFLADICAGDPLLQTAVETLLMSAAAGPATAAAAASAPDDPATRTFAASPASAAAPRRRPDDLTGERIGPYELVRRVGKGGMGAVYAARRIDQYRKLVALKLVRPGMEIDEVLRRFRRERQVLASLDHPNIARLLDGGQTEDGMPYLVMEFVEGTPIDEYCNSRRLPLADRLRLFATVCSAVQYAHGQLVIHRDIKPSNIMVTAEGVPKLLDFGIARLLSADYSEEAGLTQVQPLTPEFASPEQLRGEPIGTASDVYSLGVMLYGLLTGRRPFPATQYTGVNLAQAILTADPPKPSTAVLQPGDATVAVADDPPPRISRQLHGDLDCIVLMALRKEPQRRYLSAQALADDVLRHLNGVPVRAHKATAGYRVAKFVSRHRTGVLAATLAVLALIAATVVSVVFYHRASVERSRAEARFDDVRNLAHFVLFDFDRVIQQGTTPARKALLEKAVDYLRRLENDSHRDATLERELIEGYLKVGDLQGNLYGPNLGDKAAARESYGRALKLAETSPRRDPALVAAAQVKVADLESLGFDRTRALERYREALKVFESSGPPEALIDVLRKIGFAEYQAGDMHAALRSYERVLDLASQRPPTADITRTVVTAQLRSGELRARLGDVGNGLAGMQKALAMYEKAADENPRSPGAQRAIATACQLMADALSLAGRHPEAVRYLRRAVDVSNTLANSDPRNEQYQRDLHTSLGRLAEALAKSGQPAEARAATERALGILRPIVQRTNASEYDLQQYTWLLLTTPFAELRNPYEARLYAERLVQLTKGQDARNLDMAARAYAATGERARAVETETRALALLPPNVSSDLRRELETNLAQFTAGAGK